MANLKIKVESNVLSHHKAPRPRRCRPRNLARRRTANAQEDTDRLCSGTRPSCMLRFLERCKLDWRGCFICPQLDTKWLSNSDRHLLKYYISVLTALVSLLVSCSGVKNKKRLHHLPSCSSCWLPPHHIPGRWGKCKSYRKSTKKVISLTKQSFQRGEAVIVGRGREQVKAIHTRRGGLLLSWRA